MRPTPPPGVLRVLRGQPNRHGASDAAVYLLCGDATAGPVARIVPDDGVELPPCLLPLPRPVRVKLLHFNDLHGHIGYSHSRKGGAQAPIFSRMAAWLRETRARYAADPDAAVLAASAGDECGGAITDVLLGSDPETYQLHAGYRLYCKAGIDVGVLGNHDLDKGSALLAHAIGQEAQNVHILAANVTGSPVLSECCCPAALFVVKGLRVGFIGLVTPAQIHPEPGSERRIVDPVAVARNLVPAVRPLCDVLIVLSHLGYSLSQRGAVVEAAGDVELARDLPPGSVHLIVGGHTHSALNEGGLSVENIINGIPIVQAGKFGQYVGEVDIRVDSSVTVTDARLRATAGLPCDAEFEREQVEPLWALVQPHRERALGRVAAEADLSTDAVRNSFAAGESALANFIADALVRMARARGHPADFAMIDATSVSCGLPAGRGLCFGDWFGLMPFSDRLCLYRLTDGELGDLLQDNALRIDRPGVPHTERGFLHFSSELRYAIDLGESAGRARVVGARLSGRPIRLAPDDGPPARHVWLVASTSFLRGPAGAWEAYAREATGLPLVDLRQAEHRVTEILVRDLMVEYIAARGGVLPEGGARRDGRLRVLPGVGCGCDAQL